MTRRTWVSVELDVSEVNRGQQIQRLETPVVLVPRTRE